MSIKDLKELLNEFPDDWDVVLSIDEEGNGFHKMSGYNLCRIDPADGYYIEPQFEDEDEKELTKDKANAIVLWP